METLHCQIDGKQMSFRKLYRVVEYGRPERISGKRVQVVWSGESRTDARLVRDTAQANAANGGYYLIEVDYQQFPIA